MFFRWNDEGNALSVMDELRRGVERLFEEYDGGRGVRGAPQGRGTPSVQFSDGGTALELRADLPGVKDSDIRLTVNQDTLTLAAERKTAPPEGFRVHRLERAPWRFTRSWSLPTRVDPERVSAKLKDGVLTVILEKADEVRPRQIQVQQA